MAASKTMGRKKHDPPDLPPRPAALIVKGTPEWKEWVENAAAYCRTNVSGLVDIAITQYVKSQGYEIPPPNR